METNRTLLKKIDEFCEAKAMTRTRLGLMATGDAHFVFDLEAGKTVTLRRWQRVQTFLRNNRRMKPLFLPVEPPAAPVIPNAFPRSSTIALIP